MLSDKRLCQAFMLYTQKRHEDITELSPVGIAEVVGDSIQLSDMEGNAVATLTTAGWEYMQSHAGYTIEPPVGFEIDDIVNSRSHILGIPTM